MWRIGAAASTNLGKWDMGVRFSGEIRLSFSPTAEKGGHEGNQCRPESDLQAQKWALLPV